jgi:hypothetical protein
LCGEVPIKLMKRSNIQGWKIVQLREGEGEENNKKRRRKKEEENRKRRRRKEEEEKIKR